MVMFLWSRLIFMGSKIRKHFCLWVSIFAIALYSIWATPVLAQLPLLPKLNLESLKLDSYFNQTMVSACVRLDGRCVFELSDSKSSLEKRIKYSQEQLAEIKNIYLQSNSEELNISYQGDSQRQSIYVAVGAKNIPVVTLYERDAGASGVQLEHQAQQIADQIATSIEQAKQQRQPNFILKQARLTGVILFLTLGINFILLRWLKYLKRAKATLKADSEVESLASQLEHRKKFNLREAQYQLLQLALVTIWIGAILSILSLFPDTRSTQVLIITLLRIPLRLVMVMWLCYVLIRLSYFAIAKINTAISNNAFANSYVFHPETNRRLQVRINTFSRLIRGIATCFWVGVGLFVALSIVGVNITPFLAGAGVLGLAFSFASQNLIKDTINGLLIILEDQYAVGDVITIGEVAGLVENLNLRITQLRDGEGRLITIPNSNINLVANHSNGWSRSDLKIPVAYQANVDEAIELIERVATEMYRDSQCRENILESPQVLGVEDFAERGFIVRVWFKTEPLKQWEISREFRRRIKNAFEEAGIPLPLPQQQIWLSRSERDKN
jgi:moderate conductance mechanosensitive channel